MPADLLATVDFLHALRDAIPVILGLIVIEGLLSVDNALAIAALARHLDEKKRKAAMNTGYLGAYGFRVIALLVAAWIIQHEWIKVVGAVYLVWLMCAHFAGQKEAAEDEGAAMQVPQQTFASAIVAISLLDLSLSVDNVVAAIALSPDKLWPVYVGVTIGIISLRLVAGYAMKMIERYPVLEHAAFILIGYVGVLLMLETYLHVHFDKLIKFAGIISIIGASMVYERSPMLQRGVRPLLRMCLLPMELISAVVGSVFVLIAWPFRRVAGLFAAKGDQS